jgi:hypothetical protein
MRDNAWDTTSTQGKHMERATTPVRTAPSGVMWEMAGYEGAGGSDGEIEFEA